MTGDSDDSMLIIYWRAPRGLRGVVYSPDGTVVPGDLSFSNGRALAIWAREQGLRLVPVGGNRVWGRA